MFSSTSYVNEVFQEKVLKLEFLEKLESTENSWSFFLPLIFG